MSVKLGKRKRANPTHRAPRSPSPSEDDREGLQEIFRKAFEKNFKPLEDAVKVPKKQAEVKTDPFADGSSWDGVDSEEEGTTAVEVIEVGAVTRSEELSKSEVKAFMQSKPPLAIPLAASKPSKHTKPLDTEEEKSESLNLKNDLALQRLISESHLLSASPASNHRSKVLDMRLQALGSKTSFLQQENMPLSHRKGIAAKGAEREERRRREAKENGIILEREKRPKGKSELRVRGVGGPSVGRFKGGMLTLSKRDVADIKGPSRAGGFKKKGKR